MRDVRLEDSRPNDRLGTDRPPIPEGFLPKGEGSHSVKGYFIKKIGKAVIVSVKDMKVGNHPDTVFPLSQVYIKPLEGMLVEVYMKGWIFKEKFG